MGCRKDFFTKIKALQSYPFIIYADFETLATPINDNRNHNTFEYQNHIASSYGLIIVDWEQNIIHSSFYRGVNASEKFIEEIISLKPFINDQYERSVKPLEITPDQHSVIMLQSKCWICCGNFNEKSNRVADHNHMTGEIRGAAHQSCNLELQWNKKIPIIFHNLKL